MSMSPGQRRTLRAKIFNGRPFVECHYCGTRLTDSDITLDHLHPKAKGGGNGISNMLPACRACNRMKGDMDYRDFIAQCQYVARSAA
ncbi:HNH endonuclease [Rhodanobacter glycinis]|uniref:HNH endonuclease n=1 Tax=Rhodanobacter glycinis TaxID=582702 RepID=UPI0011272386|nr:HNH endonuclease [Rhodanobacter glycinis]TPG50165.1 HNH endonuclease [Rhodanobacter glycinis]